MNRKTIDRYVRQLPFVPFRVRTADGSAYAVAHRDFVSINDDGRELMVWTDRGMAVIDCLLISVIEEESGEQT